MPMHRIFGIETEYGITVDGQEDVNVVDESMALIRCYLEEEFIPRWNYALENPKRDVRGFEVDRLLNDEDEKVHLQKDRKRKIPFEQLKSDLILFNGARLYNDHTHPEYSTSECARLFDLVAQDKGGERILSRCARRRSAHTPKGTVRVYKNNTDFDGHSYGCHENYLMGRKTPFKEVIQGLLPFFVTRQIYAGAGKVGVEQDPGHRTGIYQLSQRADFFEVIASVDTMNKRPIVNTRDEPHADSRRYRRLHVIVGDANMSEYITALKVGTTTLVLDLIEEGLIPEGLNLRDPVRAIKEVSRDPSHTWIVEREDGSRIPAVALQRIYLDAAERYFRGRDEEADWVLREWTWVLDRLASDPLQLMGCCDWVTKKWLLDTFVVSQGLSWDRREDLSWLQSQDLEYHNVDPEVGLYYLLESQGQMARVVSNEWIASTMLVPPPDTRAYFRGKCLEKFGEDIRSINWDRVVFDVDGKQVPVDMSNLVEDGAAAVYNRAADEARTLAELLNTLAELGVKNEG